VEEGRGNPEARILEGGLLNPSRGFVYYVPECYLVVKVAG
jgi:hypothetical protein